MNNKTRKINNNQGPLKLLLEKLVGNFLMDESGRWDLY
jgi:hypothetical protein